MTVSQSSVTRPTAVVDDLVPPEVLVRPKGASFPELDEARALRGEVAGQPLQPLIGRISGGGQA